MGADVIKVEQPGIGDPMRVYEPRVGEASAFTWVTDRSKRSVALNLRDPRGVEAVRRLAEGADVVVESFRPGVADRLGVGYADLRAVNTALVYCSISGYGADGPLTSEASPVQAWVLPTDEETVIAEEAADWLSRRTC